MTTPTTTAADYPPIGTSLGPDYPPVGTCPECSAPQLAGEECQSCADLFAGERQVLAWSEDPQPGPTVTVRFTVMRTASRDRTYTTTEVAAMTGLTYRQVDYWLRRGVLGGSLAVAAQGSGTRRRFAASDVDVLRAIASYMRLARPVSGEAPLDNAATIEAAVRDAAPGGWLIVTEDEAAVVHDPAALPVLLASGGVVVALPAAGDDPAPDPEPDLLSAGAP